MRTGRVCEDTFRARGRPAECAPKRKINGRPGHSVHTYARKVLSETCSGCFANTAVLISSSFPQIAQPGEITASISVGENCSFPCRHSGTCKLDRSKFSTVDGGLIRDREQHQGDKPKQLFATREFLCKSLLPLHFPTRMQPRLVAWFHHVFGFISNDFQCSRETRRGEQMHVENLSSPVSPRNEIHPVRKLPTF